MRRLPLVVLALLAASAAPTASASPTALRFDLPEGTLPGNAIVPVNITLVVDDFMCHDAQSFVVFLESRATEGVKATWTRSNLTFTTQAHAYFAEPYRETQTVDLTVRALAAGEVELTARMDSMPSGPCFAPDGFQAATTTVLVRVDAAAPAPTPTPPAPEANATTGNQTAPANGTGKTPPAAAPTTRTPSGAPCGPDADCGPIGGFEAQESTGNDTPGLGTMGALAAVALGAFAFRRRNK